MQFYRGSQWGENGFIRLKRNDHYQLPFSNLFHKGVCGMAMSAAVPLGGFVVSSSNPLLRPQQPSPFFSKWSEWFFENEQVIISLWRELFPF